MKLDTEDRKVIVKHRLQKARNTFTEVKGIVEMGYWHAAANRLYYACFYAVTALLIKNGHSSRSHNGVFTLLGEHFVVTGIISKEQNRLYRKLFDLRQDGDYDDWVVVDESDIIPLLEPAENFITDIENLINDNK